MSILCLSALSLHLLAEANGACDALIYEKHPQPEGEQFYFPQYGVAVSLVGYKPMVLSAPCLVKNILSQNRKYVYFPPLGVAARG